MLKKNSLDYMPGICSSYSQKIKHIDSLIKYTFGC